MKSAYAYVRVSSTKQDVKRQEDALQVYAKERGFKITKTFGDVISSTKKGIDERVEFNKLKKLLTSDNNNIKHLFIHEISRLGRKTIEILKAIEEFADHGVNVHFQDLKLSTLNDDGTKKLDSSIIIPILSTMAENETRQLGDRIRSGLQSHAMQGRNFNSIVTGYDRNEQGYATINKEQANRVELIFELTAKQTTPYFVAKEVEEKFGVSMHTKTIQGIVRNPIYKGERRYKGHVIEAPAIVTKELWERANDYQSSRYKPTSMRVNKHVNVVEGKILCDYCKQLMYQVMIQKARSNKYSCFGKNGCKEKTNVNRPWLIAMIRYVVEVHKDKANTEEFKSDLNLNIKRTKTQLEEAEQRLEGAIRASTNNAEMLARERINEATFNSLDTKFKKEMETLRSQIEVHKAKIKSYKKALKSKPQHYSDDLATFKEQVRDILYEVEVGKDYVRINLENVIIYKIPKPTPTQIGWHTRKKQPFKTPFETGIEVVNVLSDEDMPSFIDEQTKPNEYFKAIDEKLKERAAKGLDNGSPKKETYDKVLEQSAEELLAKLSYVEGEDGELIPTEDEVDYDVNKLIDEYGSVKVNEEVDSIEEEMANLTEEERKEYLYKLIDDLGDTSTAEPAKEKAIPTDRKATPKEMKSFLRPYIKETYGDEFTLPKLIPDDLVMWYELALKGEELPIEDNDNDAMPPTPDEEE